MDTVFGCPCDAPISVIKGLIAAYGHPAILADLNGRVLAHNALASTNEPYLKTGESIRRLLPALEADALGTMNVGEIKKIQLKAAVGVSAAAVRFDSCYVISWHRPQAAPEGSVFDAGSAVKGGLPPLPENGEVIFHSPPTAWVETEADEDLRRQFLEKIEAVAGKAVSGIFDPSASARAICDAAKSILGEDGPSLVYSIDSARALCSGAEEDYCLAVAAFIALAAKYCDTGRVFLKGALKGSNYVFSAGFGGPGFWASPAADFGTAAELAILRRVAENDRWRITAEDDGSRVKLTLTVPVGHSAAVIFMQPLPLERAKQIVKSLLALVFPNY